MTPKKELFDAFQAAHRQPIYTKDDTLPQSMQKVIATVARFAPNEATVLQEYYDDAARDDDETAIEWLFSDADQDIEAVLPIGWRAEFVNDAAFLVPEYYCPACRHWYGYTSLIDCCPHEWDAQQTPPPLKGSAP